MNDGARPNLEPIEKMVDGLGVGAVFGEPVKEGGARGARGRRPPLGRCAACRRRRG
jgi:hypothetical protein